MWGEVSVVPCFDWQMRACIIFIRSVSLPIMQATDFNNMHAHLYIGIRRRDGLD